jgi:hypothetical protein
LLGEEVRKTRTRIDYAWKKAVVGYEEKKGVKE